ncbi:MAG TPA: hypothetical protein VGK54_03250 [Chloroflexota bacterium]|jgi:hypothetical protein
MSGFIFGLVKGALVGTALAVVVVKREEISRFVKQLDLSWQPPAKVEVPSWDARLERGLESFRATFDETRARLEAELAAARRKVS